MLKRALIVMFKPVLLFFLVFPSVLGAQSLRIARTVWASTPTEVPALASEIDQMLRTGHLQFGRDQADGTFPGRHHERMNQYHQGVRVFWRTDRMAKAIRFGAVCYREHLRRY